MNRLRSVLGLALTLPAAVAGAQPPADGLAAGFRIPPDSAKPRVWWHWTRSNVTKDGITKDLEWMKRVGVGGFFLADVNAGGGQEVAAKIPFGTPEWYDAVRFAATEAKRLNLEMGIFSSPGWSETGGPWVRPQQAMKKLVWSETAIPGGAAFHGTLPHPPENNGQFGNSGAQYYPQGGADPTYYADSAVLAYPTPAGDVDAAAAHPKVTTDEGPVDGSALLDGQLDTRLTLPAPKGGGPAWVQFEFAQPYLARAITLGGKGGSANGIPVGRLLASDDGRRFRTLVTLPGAQLYRQSMVRTYDFPPTEARFYRIELSGAPLGPAATMSQAPAEPAAHYVLSEAVLHSGARVNRWEEKAGFSFLFQYETVPTPATPAAATVPVDRVIDLTGRMGPDGALDWDAPPGRWTVLRLGFSLTGAKNRPATPAGSGFEVDKLSPDDVEAYYHGYFDPLQKALGPLFGTTLKYVMMDSWEAGTNNWTDGILQEFQRRRGYDARPYLPVLTGRVVGSAQVSDRFTWDFRRTLADLWAEAHYGTLARMLREHGVGIVAEASGVSLEMPEDTLLNKREVEIPAGEFWVHDLHPRLMYLQDVRGAASASHAYGKPLTATESYTGGGYEAPFTLKTVSDFWFAQGTNRIMIHTSAHQPLDTKPGNTMVGTHFNRNITWAEDAAPFLRYLARQCYVLQQGRFVADLAYLLDEGAPSTPPIWGMGTRPAPPDGYDYDFVNADILLHRMKVADDGRIVLPDGMSYRVLVLPETDRMRPELVRAIGKLVRGGATVVGGRPEGSPSLSGYPACDEDVRRLANDIWGDLNGQDRTIRRCGKGWVYWGWPVDQVLAKRQIAKDFEYEQGLDARVAWIHRRSADADFYYLANLTDEARSFAARFRVTGKQAEVWHPDTGRIEAAGYAIEGVRTTVPLKLAQRESVFVVFRQAAGENLRRDIAPSPEPSVFLTIDGPWKLTFAPGPGTPGDLLLSGLQSWTANADPGVKYYSGTGTYTTRFTLPGSATPATVQAQRVVLDLGRVGDLAHVRVNGRAYPVLWKPPYQIDLTRAVHPGDNQLEVAVTDEWTNRIAGDRQLPDAQKVLGPGAGGMRFNGGSEVLPPSGLLGPVRLLLASGPAVAGDFDSEPRQARARSHSPRDDRAAWTSTDFAAANPKLPTLVVAGDSTASTGDPDHRGWGAVLGDYFDPAKINVINRAIGGRSFRTFYGEGAWRRIVDALKPGDFAIIEFGHNDGGRPDLPPFRGDLPGIGDDTVVVRRRDGSAETVHSYGWYARTFVREVRAKGATPILASTTVRNLWTPDKKVERGMGDMLGWVRQVAAQERVLFIDHSNLIADRYEAMGPDAVAPLFPADHTHTSTEGAILNAQALISGFKQVPIKELVAALKPTP